MNIRRRPGGGCQVCIQTERWRDAAVDHRDSRDPREGDVAPTRCSRVQGVRDPCPVPLRHSWRGDPDEDRCIAQRGIEFAPWGIAIVKAMVLAKFMLVGSAMKIGERFTKRPLIWPTLHKAFAFLLLLIIMTVIEEAVVGLIHNQPIAASLGDLFGPKLEETIAGYPHHAAGAHSVFRFPGSRRGARRGAAVKDVLCQAGADRAQVRAEIPQLS